MAAVSSPPVPNEPQSRVPSGQGTGGGAQKRASTPVSRTRAAAKDDSNSKTSPPGTTLREPSSSPGAPGTQQLRGVAEATLRAGFLRKVYSILAAQMVVTVAVAVACTWTPAIQSFFLALFHSHSRLLQVAVFVPTFSSLLCLRLGLQGRYPWNYILLMVFTLGQSVNVGYICAVYEANGLGWVVVQAFAITAVLFVILTAYALRSGKDFSYMRGFLFTALSGLVAAGVAGIFFPSIAGNLVLAAIGALTFCGYILYDTWRIEKKFSYDDFIPATIELYLDIINLFLYILKILQKLQKKKDE